MRKVLVLVLTLILAVSVTGSCKAEIPETSIEAPNSVTATAGDVFTVRIELMNLPPGVIEVVVEGFTSDPGPTPEIFLELPPLRGVTDTGETMELVIESSESDIIDFIPEIILQIGPSSAKDERRARVLPPMIIFLEFEAQNKGRTELTVTFKRLIGEEESIIQRVIEVTVE